MRHLAHFDARDHFGGGLPTIRAGLDRFLVSKDAALPAGSRVSMLAHARVFGYVFNPISVYWCHGPDGELRHVVAEVHNTYGERHCYLLGPEAARGTARAAKEFYVSPFLDVDGGYRMRLPEPDGRLELMVQLAGGADGARLTATVRGSAGPPARGVPYGRRCATPGPPPWWRWASASTASGCGCAVCRCDRAPDTYPRRV